MADPDNNKEALNKIETFDLVTEGLLSLDAYKETHDKSYLSEAQKTLNQALEKLKENKKEPLYSRAEYFSLMVEYLNGSQEVANKFGELITCETLSQGSAYDAEVGYNAGAAYYSQKMYLYSAAFFQTARSVKAASPEVRLLAGAGAALSLAKQASELDANDDETQQKKASDLVKRVDYLYNAVRRELRINFLRRLLGAPHVERALSRKARKLIEEAKEEVSRISPPRPQTPVVTTEPPTSQSGGLAGAT